MPAWNDDYRPARPAVPKRARAPGPPTPVGTTGLGGASRRLKVEGSKDPSIGCDALARSSWSSQALAAIAWSRPWACDCLEQPGHQAAIALERSDWHRCACAKMLEQPVGLRLLERSDCYPPGPRKPIHWLPGLAGGEARRLSRPHCYIMGLPGTDSPRSEAGKPRTRVRSLPKPTSMVVMNCD